jgi:hypothetical protein
MRQDIMGHAAPRGIRLNGSAAATMQKIVIAAIDLSCLAEALDRVLFGRGARSRNRNSG